MAAPGAQGIFSRRYGVGYALRNQGLGGLGALAMSESITALAAAAIVGLNQVFDKLGKALDQRIAQALANVQTPQDVQKVFQQYIGRAQVEGGGAPFSARGGQGGLLSVLRGKPTSIEGLPGAPATTPQETAANVDAAIKQFVHDRPAFAYQLAQQGGPYAAKIIAELGRQHAISQFGAQAQVSYARSPYAPVTPASITNVTVNAPYGDRNTIGLSIKAAQDARDRNNGRYVTTFQRR